MSSFGDWGNAHENLAPPESDGDSDRMGGGSGICDEPFDEKYTGGYQFGPGSLKIDSSGRNAASETENPNAARTGASEKSAGNINISAQPASADADVFANFKPKRV